MVHFTSIRQEEDNLKADQESDEWSPKNCIEPP